MEDKLDKVISLVTNLIEKFNASDPKVEKLSKKMEIFEETVNDKFAQVDKKLKCKAPLAYCNELKQKISFLEDQLDGLYSDFKKNARMKESYEKRLNILVPGLQEAESPWEKREDSLALFHDFMRDGLKIDQPTSIAVVDAHRLPQRPTYHNGKRICRPIIVKLATMLDKNKIFGLVKNLKVLTKLENRSSCTTSLFTYPTIYPKNLFFRGKGSIPNVKKLYLITRNHSGALRTVLTTYTSTTLKCSTSLFKLLLITCLFRPVTCLNLCTPQIYV